MSIYDERLENITLGELKEISDLQFVTEDQAGVVLTEFSKKHNIPWNLVTEVCFAAVHIFDGG